MKKQFVGVGPVGNKKDLTDKIEDISESVCKHFNYCAIKISGRDCSHPAYEACQTWKFWKKYPGLLKQ